MEVLVRLIGSILLIHGLANNEETVSQLLLFAGGLTLLFAIYGHAARRRWKITAP
jgi:hypothetical protein